MPANRHLTVRLVVQIEKFQAAMRRVGEALGPMAHEIDWLSRAIEIPQGFTPYQSAAAPSLHAQYHAKTKRRNRRGHR